MLASSSSTSSSLYPSYYNTSIINRVKHQMGQSQENHLFLPEILVLRNIGV